MQKRDEEELSKKVFKNVEVQDKAHGLKIFKLIVFLIYFLATVVLNVLLIKANFLPKNYLIIILVGLTLINVFIAYLLFYKPSRLKNILAAVIIIISLVAIVIASDAINQLVKTIEEMNKPVESTMDISVIVNADDSIDNLEDIETEKVSYVEQKLFSEDEKLNALNEGKHYKAYPDLLRALLRKDERVILLNENFRTVLEDLYPEFVADTKIIYSTADQEYLDKLNKEREEILASREAGDFSGTEPHETVDPNLDEDPLEGSIQSYEDIAVDGTKPFTFYISGIDTYGSIDTTSRSDVNIMGVVNPLTHKVLLVNVPRDSYVPIAGTGGYYDKLTHAGVLGVQASLGTMENLAGRDISTYVKVNFDSLIDIVDVLGGVTVHNPYAFSAGGYYFKQGDIRMDGKMALRFSRERKSLPDGDNDRGRNQMRVIEGIINEATKVENLKNYRSLLDSVSSSFKTNLSSEAIANLVKNELSTNEDWQVESISIEGEGAMGLPSYFMPGYRLYFTKLDKNSISEARIKMAETLSY